MDLKSLNERLFNLIKEDQYEGADEEEQYTVIFTDGTQTNDYSFSDGLYYKNDLITEFPYGIDNDEVADAIRTHVELELEKEVEDIIDGANQSLVYDENYRKTSKQARINEIQVDPELRDRIQKGSDKLREPYKGEIEYAKSNLDKYPDDDFYKRQYERALRQYKQSNDFDKLYKKLYNTTRIDLEQATIDKIPVPDNGNELLSLLKDGYPTILSSGDELFLFDNKGYKVYGDKALNGFLDVNGRQLNMDSDKNIKTAGNRHLFDNAWKVHGPSTKELRDQRWANRQGSVDRNKYGWDVDKSGYPTRNLSKELADKKRGDYINQINNIKQQSVDLRRQLVQKIKTSDIEDIDVNTFNRISNALNQLNQVNTSKVSYGDSEDANKYVADSNKLLDNLKDIIDNI